MDEEDTAFENELDDGYESMMEEIEVLPDEDVPDTDTFDSDDLPVRWLTQFTFIDVNNNNSITDVETMVNEDDSSYSPEGYGLAQAVGVMVDNDEVDTEDGEDVDAADLWYRMRLGSIIETWYNPWDASGEDHLWVRTQIAWYVLVDPADEYAACHDDYSEFKGRTRVALSIMLSYATRNYDITWEEFLQELAVRPEHHRRRNLDRTDFEGNENLVRLLGEAMDSIPPEHEKVKDCPLLRKIGGKDLGGKVATWVYPSGYAKHQHLIASTFSATPIVAQLADPYFAADRLRILDMEPTIQTHERLGDIPDLPLARRSAPKITVSGPNHIIVNEVHFEKGDTILLCESQGAKVKIPRFGLFHELINASAGAHCQVCIQEILHSSETVVAELGSPSELFMTRKRMNISPDLLKSVVSVDFSSTTSDPEKQYECRFFYDKDTLAFTSIHELDAFGEDETSSELQLPMRGLDLFAGTGGLAAAFAGAVGKETVSIEHAIDNNASAAATMRHRSHGHVHCQDVNDALERAILTVQDELPHDSLLNKDVEGNILPPAITEAIDIIFGGFPCQGHSALNLFKRSIDARNPLLIPQLAWVEFLRPKYCVFENVPRFVTTQLTRPDHPDINHGYLKFLVQALLRLGYQCRFTVFQAAHYGSPQTRQRFILVAGRLDMALPDLPCPTHQSTVKCLSLHKHIGMLDVHNCAIPQDTTKLLRPITIWDSIKDLPFFDWTDDHINHVTIPDHSTKKVLQHMNTFYSSHVMAITTLIRMEPGASSQDLNLPESARSARRIAVELHAKERMEKTKKSFVRLGWHAQFHTIVTNVSPVALSSHVLHPICRRVLTVRELARAQGFPDDFAFRTIYDDDPDKYTQRLKEIHRQLGNAVPWQLATAIGQEFRKTLWEEA